MSRSLHKKDICRRSNRDLQGEISNIISGETLVLAAKDSRLKSLLPIDGQQPLFGNHLSFGGDATLCIEPLSGSHSDPETHFPTSHDERFHHESNSYDTVCMIFPKCGYFQRGAPFLDATRICRRGGTILGITGIQPEKPPDHDAKWWVPNSDDVTIDEIVLIRYEDYKTPILLSSFTTTTNEVRQSDATITTTPNGNTL